MFKSNYLSGYYNKLKFNKKIKTLNNINIKKTNYIYNLELILKIPSSIENKHKFIIMLILMDKYLNNKLTFLIDTKTISRSKCIKIGCIINLTSEMLHIFLNIHKIHNIYKYYENEITFNFSNINLMRYETKKILSNLVFHFDTDVNYYYDYLNEFNYEITIFLKSIFNNIWYNRLFLTQNGFYFFNLVKLNLENIKKESWFNAILEEQNKNESDNILLDISTNLFNNKSLENNTYKKINNFKYTF